MQMLLGLVQILLLLLVHLNSTCYIITLQRHRVQTEYFLAILHTFILEISKGC